MPTNLRVRSLREARGYLEVIRMGHYETVF